MKRKRESATNTNRRHTMMFAFVMAVVGVAVVGTLNLLAAR